MWILHFSVLLAVLYCLKTYCFSCGYVCQVQSKPNRINQMPLVGICVSVLLCCGDLSSNCLLHILARSWVQFAFAWISSPGTQLYKSVPTQVSILLSVLKGVGERLLASVGFLFCTRFTLRHRRSTLADRKKTCKRARRSKDMLISVGSQQKYAKDSYRGCFFHLPKLVLLWVQWLI